MTKNSEEGLSVWEHLSELRTYFFFVLATLIVGGSITHIYHEKIITLLFAPLKGQPLIFLSPLDPILFILKIDFYGALGMALPVIFFCFFRFIAPALGSRGSIFVSTFLFFSTLLIIAASVYTCLLLIPLSIGFLLSIQVPGVENFFTADQYLSFVFMELALMVAIFQIPCVIALLTLTKLLNPILLSKNRGIVYVVTTVALSFLTPTTDLFSICLFLIPTLVIFELSVILGKTIYWVRNRPTATYE